MIDSNHLRRRFAMLSDQALSEIDRDELVEEAQKCLDQEIANRKLNDPPKVPEDSPVAVESAWRTSAVCVCAFSSFPGRADAPKADEARSVLEAAGIPCYIETREVDPDSALPRPAYDLDVMVPAALLLRATSVLDTQIFNIEQQETWRRHLQELSDANLRAIRIEDVIDGFLDRAERLKHEYQEEMRQRGFGKHNAGSVS
jgi:hypothetical protein